MEKSELMSIMADVWKSVLSLEKLPSYDDSFFDIGGNSFFAVQVFQDFEDKTGIALEVTSIYEHETIESLISSIK